MLFAPNIRSPGIWRLRGFAVFVIFMFPNYNIVEDKYHFVDNAIGMNIIDTFCTPMSKDQSDVVLSTVRSALSKQYFYII